jgi:hypothetical protein
MLNLEKSLHMKTPVALQYENRKGEVYYLQEGKTRTGKPKYYTGKKLSGTSLAALPEGYEFYERPDNAQVVVRKIKPSAITEFERKQAEEIVRRASGLEHFRVDVEDDALVVYTPSFRAAEADELFAELAGPLMGTRSPRMDEFRENQIRGSQYMPMLRFELVNPGTRLYRAYRWCFLGSIDRWISLHEQGMLDSLVEGFARHLDQESFFELM